MELLLYNHHVDKTNVVSVRQSCILTRVRIARILKTNDYSLPHTQPRLTANILP